MKEYLSLVIAPNALPVSINDFKNHARVRIDTTTEDEYIKSIILAAAGAIDGRDGWLGRALITQTWKLTMDIWPNGRTINLHLPPLDSVTSVKYYDANNTLQTFDASNYNVITTTEPGQIELVDGASWPSTYNRSDAIFIEFVCGYGGSHVQIPERIKQYIKIHAGELYMNREETIVGASIVEIPHVRNMLDNYRKLGINNACR